MITWELALLMLLAVVGGTVFPIWLAGFFIGRWADEQCKRLDALLDPVARDAKVEAEVAKRLKERS